MARDPRKRYVGAGRKRGVERVGGIDLDGHTAPNRDAMQRQLPGQEPLQRGDRRRRGHHVVERAEHRDAGGHGVVAAGLGADHGLVDASRASLPDPPVEVDREVVADVVPAAHVAVEAVDRHQHRRDVAAGVAVGSVGVVDERQPDVAVAGRVARRRLALSPRRARDDRRLPRPGVEYGARSRERAGRRCARRLARADEVQADAVDRSVGAHLHAVSGSGPDRLAEQRDAARGGGVGDGAVSAVGAVTKDRGERPAAPLAVGRSRAQLDSGLARTAPLDARQREANRRCDRHGTTIDRAHPAARDPGRAGQRGRKALSRQHQRGRPRCGCGAEQCPAREVASCPRIRHQCTVRRCYRAFSGGSPLDRGISAGARWRSPGIHRARPSR